MHHRHGKRPRAKSPASIPGRPIAAAGSGAFAGGRQAGGKSAALNDRGAALGAMGRPEEALACFDAALAQDPDHVDALNNRGLLLGMLGRHEEALVNLDRAAQHAPRRFDVLCNRGFSLNESGRHEEALACLDQAVAMDPQHFGAQKNRTVALARLDRVEEALAACEQISRLRPDDLELRLNLAFMLSQLHRHEESLVCIDHVLAVQANHLDALISRSSCLLSLHRIEDAKGCLEQALAIAPDHVEALNSYGALLWNMNRCDEARAAFDKALRHSPGHPGAITNIGVIDLALGRLPQGFGAMELRWQTQSMRRARFVTSAPLWNGNAPLEGKTLLLSHEQGFGDTLQFARYALLAARRAQRVILAVPAALRDVLSSLPGAFEFVVEGERLPPHDLHTPFMTLPLAFGTTLETIPAQMVPYLAAHPARTAAWAQRLGPAQRPRIGITWAGRQYPPLNIPRDMTLEFLRPLFDLDAEFITLQKDVPAGDRAVLDALPQLARHGESLTDFADTAALIANLDLVIAVDTSVVHLAGAMGKPVWLLNRYAACWRWLRDRDDSPWYPTLRQFRQTALDDWSGVVQRTRRALEQYLAHGGATVAPAAITAPAAFDPHLPMEQGVAAAARGDYETALGCFTRILEREPGHVGALYNLGATLASAGYNDEALVCLDKALAIEPGNVDLLCNRGLVLGRLLRFEEALDCFDAVLSRAAPRADALNGRGLALANLERHEESLPCFEQALVLAPHDLGIVRNRGLALGKLHRFEEALVCFWRILAAHPEDADAHLNRGIMLDRLGRRDEALSCFERALELDPELAEARCDRGLIKLGRGDFKGGFEDFDSRWDAFLKSIRLDTAAPQWRGEPLHGKTILLHHEQGFGDTLQFVRYAPLIAARGGRVVILGPPALHDLLMGLSCEVQLEAQLPGEQRPLPPHDYHCPMMSLPLAFGTTLETIPAEIPYLHADPARAAFWSERLGPPARRPRIGLAWAGRQYPPVNHTRDLPLEVLLPLLALDADFVSLQNEVPASDLPLLERSPVLARHGEACRDFADTAALISGLDLVITADTAVAHLAGTMGKPVWIISRYAACWRWLDRRADSPWYPSARLFYQAALRDWAGVAEQVRGELQALLTARASAEA
ncbi:MAG: hypothetical protein JWR07_1505 [Nevskia sp.]|nr:hypothetical protein [Nevskia sp.]